MRFTEEMIAEDEKRWHARAIAVEVGYCSEYMKDRKNLTNLDLRFYAYLFRKCAEYLKILEPTTPQYTQNAYGHKFYYCPKCGKPFYELRPKYCDTCGKALKWPEKAVK